MMNTETVVLIIMWFILAFAVCLYGLGIWFFVQAYREIKRDRRRTNEKLTKGN